MHSSHDCVPLTIWVLLWGGGLITVAFTYFFGVKSIRSQVLMAAALTAEIAFVLFLIVAIDDPFRCNFPVTSQSFRHVLERIADESL